MLVEGLYMGVELADRKNIAVEFDERGDKE